MNSTMKIEIWSDVVCPFCYIGKARFDEALQDFTGRNQVTIEWKSYQLMPEIITETGKHIDQVLAETKGLPIEQARQMNVQVARMAGQAGLAFNFDKAIVANTFKAHQFLHFAKTQHKQHEAESVLFEAYFTNGRNVDDLQTLLELGSSIGLDPVALEAAIKDEAYAQDVQTDIREARQLGVRGVPFFLFNRKYAVSGAHEAEMFQQILEKSYAEWLQENPGAAIETIGGVACNVDGTCN